MLFEQIATGGCQSYLVGCEATCAAVLIDPEIRQLDRYHAHAARDGLRIRYVVDTHTHADHFSAAHHFGQTAGIPVVMHRDSPAPFADMRLDDGDILAVGNLRLTAMHTPGHTRDSMCLRLEDRIFTGDTLLIGATGRTDLPTGDPEALFDSLFNRLARLDPALKVYPAHDYKNQGSSTIGRELAENPRLQVRDREAFCKMMRELNLSAPTHITEALRTNMSGGRTVAQLLAEAAAKTPFMSLDELRARVERKDPLIVLDVREKDAYQSGHVPGARHLPRGQLELRVNEELPDPTLADPDRLRVRQDLDARGRDAARSRLSTRGRARRRHEGLARRRLPARKMVLQTATADSEQLHRIDVDRPADPARLRQRLDLRQPGGQQPLQRRVGCRTREELRAVVAAASLHRRRGRTQDLDLRVAVRSAQARARSRNACAGSRRAASARSTARRVYGGQPAARRSSSAAAANSS